ncbi:MAG TPA: hypothetical protein VF796_00405 [Humisphaera sp.]
MPYRLWHVIGKLGVPLLLAMTAGGAALFHFHPGEGTAWLFVAPLALLVAVGGLGAYFGLLLTLGRLRMRCPFCGLYGPVGGNKRDGAYMNCMRCGYVHTAGFGGWRIVREGAAAADQ